MPQIADHFRILGLDFCESITQLSAAYRRAMLEWHPDRFHCDSAMQKTATKHAAEINAAFEHLFGAIREWHLAALHSSRAIRPEV